MNRMPSAVRRSCHYRIVASGALALALAPALIAQTSDLSGSTGAFGGPPLVEVVEGRLLPHHARLEALLSGEPVVMERAGLAPLQEYFVFEVSTREIGSASAVANLPNPDTGGGGDDPGVSAGNPPPTDSVPVNAKKFFSMGKVDAVNWHKRGYSFCPQTPKVVAYRKEQKLWCGDKPRDERFGNPFHKSYSDQCPEGGWVIYSLKSSTGEDATEMFIPSPTDLFLGLEFDPLAYTGAVRNFRVDPDSLGYPWLKLDFRDGEGRCFQNHVKITDRQTGELLIENFSDLCSWQYGPYDITTKKGRAAAEAVMNQSVPRRFEVPPEWEEIGAAVVDSDDPVFIIIRKSGWGPVPGVALSETSFRHHEYYIYGLKGPSPEAGAGLGSLGWISSFRPKLGWQLRVMKYSFQDRVETEAFPVLAPDLCEYR